VGASNLFSLSEYKNNHPGVIKYIKKIKNRKSLDSSKIIKNSNLLKSNDDIKLGTWFEFINKNKRVQRVELQGISQVTGKLLFVNSRGLKAFEKKELFLSKGLEKETIRVIKKESLFDRALSKIASDLKINQT
jgi:hypothetical protein